MMRPEQDLWQSVIKRETTEAFVYAVRSTGVYCRPSCPSRRPRPENVRFFERPDQAESAGFRPCRRCHPKGDPARAALTDRLRRYIESNLDGAVRLEELAAHGDLSQHQVLRLFRGATGVTPRQYADALRMGQVRTGLRGGAGVAAATYDAGFGSSSRLYERAAGAFGMTPATYAKGAPGVTIRYTIADSPLGRLLAAATPAGVCAVRLGGSASVLESELRAEFPRADIQRDDRALAGIVKNVLAGVSQPLAALPLDVRATAFQRQVWEALRAIPRGQTRSYSQVALSIGRPRAVRAVANACAANPVALAIPCHRVVRDDGSLGGYRWGLRRKQALLAAEQ